MLSRFYEGKQQTYTCVYYFRDKLKYGNREITGTTQQTKYLFDFRSLKQLKEVDPPREQKKIEPLFNPILQG